MDTKQTSKPREYIENDPLDRAIDAFHEIHPLACNEPYDWPAHFIDGVRNALKAALAALAPSDAAQAPTDVRIPMDIAIDARRMRTLCRLLDAIDDMGNGFPDEVHVAFQDGGARTRAALDAAATHEDLMHAAPVSPAAAAPSDDARALVDALTLECEKFWWNDGPEGKSADAMNAAKAAVLAALAAPTPTVAADVAAPSAARVHRYSWTASGMKHDPDGSWAMASDAAAQSNTELDAYLLDRLSNLLEGVAIALKGPEEAMNRHDFQDLPGLAQTLMCEVELHREREAAAPSDEGAASDANDAARYRWLRERAWYVDAATYALELRERWVHDAPPCDADEVEQALDGARSGGCDGN
ncbi:hypothetical protein [Paraburkholderia heleia]|uniref:hypothetical protein n=1 Tax=Paraburkholderia heleia TaxID=634127 RepID=UPI002AB734FA|nr:hypothetical protein [Paraburkholderia heleia]